MQSKLYCLLLMSFFSHYFIAQQKKNYIISLGPDCHLGLMLRELKIREFALPFDWLITDNFKKLTNCIAERFEFFLDERFLILKQHTVAPTTIIRNILYNFSFVHDFPVSTGSVEISGDNTETGTIVPNWKEYISQVMNKYRKRIDRFYELLRSHHKLIFLRLQEITLEDAKYFIDHVLITYPNLDFNLIVLHSNPKLHKMLKYPKLVSLLNLNGFNSNNLSKALVTIGLSNKNMHLPQNSFFKFIF